MTSSRHPYPSTLFAVSMLSLCLLPIVVMGANAQTPRAFPLSQEQQAQQPQRPAQQQAGQRQGGPPAQQAIATRAQTQSENVEWTCGFVNNFKPVDTMLPGGAGLVTRTKVTWGNGDKRSPMMLVGNFVVPMRDKSVYAFLVRSGRDQQGNTILADQRGNRENITIGDYCPGTEKK